MSPVPDDGPIVLFDGVCGLCNGAARFIAARDHERRFWFAHLQSPAAAALMADWGWRDEPLESVVLVRDGEILTRSDAALAIARELDGAWSALGVFRFVPRVLRDAVYRLVARKRYDWFGRTDACQIPPAGLASRFVPAGEGPAPTSTETSS
jgi:predicted DCC family thiol-disulfide oxidoreductase YuxK